MELDLTLICIKMCFIYPILVIICFDSLYTFIRRLKLSSNRLRIQLDRRVCKCGGIYYSKNINEDRLIDDKLIKPITKNLNESQVKQHLNQNGNKDCLDKKNYNNKLETNSIQIRSQLSEKQKIPRQLDDCTVLNNIPKRHVVSQMKEMFENNSMNSNQSKPKNSPIQSRDASPSKFLNTKYMRYFEGQPNPTNGKESEQKTQQCVNNNDSGDKAISILSSSTKINKGVKEVVLSKHENDIIICDNSSSNIIVQGFQNQFDLSKINSRNIDSKKSNRLSQCSISELLNNVEDENSDALQDLLRELSSEQETYLLKPSQLKSVNSESSPYPKIPKTRPLYRNHKSFSLENLTASKKFTLPINTISPRYTSTDNLHNFHRAISLNSSSGTSDDNTREIWNAILRTKNFESATSIDDILREEELSRCLSEYSITDLLADIPSTNSEEFLNHIS